MTIRALHEGVRIALQALRQSKLRTGLTVLGVAVGVLVVVVIAGVINGINQSFDEIVEASGPNTFYIVRAYGVEVSTGLEEEDPLWMRRPPLRPEFATQLESAPSIENAYPVADFSWIGVRLRAGTNEVQAAIFGVTPDFLQTYPGDIMEGRWFTNPEDAAGRPVAVIDSSVAHDLFAPLDPIGRKFRLGSESFEVIGVYRPPANLFARLSNPPVYVPFQAAKKYLMPPVSFLSFNDFVYFGLVAEPKDGLVRAIDQITGRMRTLRNLTPGQSNNFDVVTQEEVNDLWNQLTAVLFAVMFALSSVGLMVGGVGVIAVMVVSVTERTREIGVRKALGATKRDVLWQFLVEAATLTTVGGGFGLALGGLIAWSVSTYTPVPASIPIWSIVVALAAAAFTGIVFGLYPAIRAARLDPVAALRYE